MLLLNFMLHVAAADAAVPCVPFQGGPAEGMCPGRVTSKQGPLELVRLLPAPVQEAAIPPQLASTLSTLLDSQRTGKPIDDKILATAATTEVCLIISEACRIPMPLQVLPVGKEFVPNRPYLLTDGRVRIEWARDGELKYFSIVTFEGAKVKHVATTPASVPRMVPWSSYQSGPLRGMGVDFVVRPDNGVRAINLTPSSPNASPIPAEDARAVQAFMDAFQQRDRSKLQGFLTDDAKLQACMRRYDEPCDKPVGFERVQVGTECTFNTPYYLGNHVVRLEWLLKGVMWYWTELHLTDGKISFVRVHRPEVPDEVRAPYSDLEGLRQPIGL